MRVYGEDVKCVILSQEDFKKGCYEKYLNGGTINIDSFKIDSKIIHTAGIIQYFDGRVNIILKNRWGKCEKYLNIDVVKKVSKEIKDILIGL